MKSHDSTKISVFWFRRDLRLKDNHGLFRALKSGAPVLPIFIFDKNILEKLPKKDRRVEFIQQRLQFLNKELSQHGSGLQVEVGRPSEVFEKLFKENKIGKIFCNEDYEPYARARDEAIEKLAKQNGVEFEASKDQVIFAKNEVVKDNGTPYLVYTPYSKKWLSLFSPEKAKPFESESLLHNCLKLDPQNVPSLQELGFESAGEPFPSTTVSSHIFKNYASQRDFLAEKGTSRLGLHLRFGSISIRELAAYAQKSSEVFLKELIWREFFMQMLFHYPHTTTEPFDARYKGLPWRNNENEFKAWCEGRTGYPVVDAGMRELNATGFMHNRARMIVASFLTKHLLIDWQWGERYFAEKLLDFELSANVGNWQWAAGCGCDAAPYFRVFNPTLQAKKFDPDGKYVKLWVPEANSMSYPEPIVDHEMARRRALTTYESHLKKGKS